MSGVEWAPNLPRGWNGASLRWLSEIYAGGTPNKGKFEFWTNGTIAWLNSGSVNDWSIRKPSALITYEAYSGSSAKWIPVGSVVIALAGQGKTKGMAARLEIDSTCNQSMAAIVPGHKLDYRFLHFWLAANYQNIRNMAGGDKRDGLNLVHIASIEVPLPPLDEQQVIADYLDRETQRIDELITEQRGLIETLRERRQGVIDAEFEKLPECRVGLRRYIDFVTSGSRGWGGYYADSGETFVRIGNLSRGSLSLGGERKFVDLPPEVTEGQRTVLSTDDLLFSITAFIGSIAVVSEDWAGAYVSQHVALCRLDGSSLKPRFIGYFALSTEGNLQLTMGAVGGTKVQLALDDIKALQVPLVPLATQERTSAIIADQTTRIDALIAESEDLIALSLERRAALITAAVTGQIDVRTAT